MARKFASADRILPDQGTVLRQPLANRLVHWGVAVSILTLFFSGFGQMPLYKRYMLADLPGMAWTADYAVTIGLHYAAAALLLLVGTFHLAYHGLRRDLGLLPRRGDLRESWLIIKAMLTRGQEPPSHKYLAEQRLAYAFIGGSALLVVLTGVIKVVKNLPGVALSEQALWLTTTGHNLGTILLLFGIIGHLVAFVIPANRKLLAGMFGGKVDLAYVEHRHCLWCKELREKDEQPEVADAPAAAAESPRAQPSPAAPAVNVGQPRLVAEAPAPES